MAQALAGGLGNIEAHLMCLGRVEEVDKVYMREPEFLS
jgi:hypothetical protein